MADPGIDVVQLAAALHGLNEFAEEHAPLRRSPVLDVGEEHLGTDPTVLGVVSDEHPLVERPNLQLAFDAWAAREGNELELLGLVVPHRGAIESSLPELLVANRWSAPDFGPISYVEVPAGVDASLTCVANALLLLRVGGVPVLGLPQRRAAVIRRSRTWPARRERRSRWCSTRPPG